MYISLRLLDFQDIFINFLIAIFFFGGAVPLGMHASEWAVWRSRGTDMENTMYGLYRIVSSVGAEAVSKLFIRLL